MNLITIAIDFDGTVCDHRYPLIGPEAPEAVKTLKDICDIGHRIILYTMRSGHDLGDAIDWFISRNITLWGVQFNPQQAEWTQSNKCYANLYIDDAAFGCPLIHPPGFHRPCVDWKAVRKYLLEEKYDDKTC